MSSRIWIILWIGGTPWSVSQILKCFTMTDTTFLTIMKRAPSNVFGKNLNRPLQQTPLYFSVMNIFPPHKKQLNAYVYVQWQILIGNEVIWGK